MTTNKGFLAILGAGALVLASPAASALDAGNMYFGADLANSSYDVAGASESATGFRLYAGFPINETVNFEAAWVDQGEAESSYTDAWGSGTETVSLDGLQFSVVGSMPVQDNMSLFGRVGLYMWNASYVDMYNGSLWASADDDGSDIFFGVGLDYQISDTMSVRAEYDIISIEVGGVDADANSLSIGVSIKN